MSLKATLTHLTCPRSPQVTSSHISDCMRKFPYINIFNSLLGIQSHPYVIPSHPRRSPKATQCHPSHLKSYKLPQSHPEVTPKSPRSHPEVTPKSPQSHPEVTSYLQVTQKSPLTPSHPNSPQSLLIPLVTSSHPSHPKALNIPQSHPNLLHIT